MKALIRLLFKRRNHASIKNQWRGSEPTLETFPGSLKPPQRSLADSPDEGLDNSSTPLVEGANYRLPFDVLAQIFDYIREMESTSFPLERILAVCHFWRDAALDHAPLWTSFNARIISDRDVAFWKYHFKRRVNRCGIHALLDINIELINRERKEKFPDTPRGNFQRIASSQVAPDDIPTFIRVLQVFAGTHGTMATRWRKLILDLSRVPLYDHNEDEVIGEFLQHRTPNLESLQLYGVRTRFMRPRIFPYAPRLLSAVYHSCNGLLYPEGHNLTSLT
ncbi:hypothetical protein M408DRAFT_169055 [Serendipita vermifera MAFF 305830]|uniref:F-box domain-containing protein n=1 Tax=Serendipita vermifera MAFF 305830 TaxID=933852 RepID=A0A0C3B564_SERVB|nr:hypothetical protein M408DRAFT_169055 [Serendipita vermifera MAFF 305830]